MSDFFTSMRPPEAVLGYRCETEAHQALGHNQQVRFAVSDRIARPRIGMGSQP